ncbi:MAG: class I SAM-dependent methyltransferase [Candidatus Xenobia bacterium]
MSTDSSLYRDPERYDLISHGVPHDVAFYQEEARQAAGPVLELACGTGRVLEGLLEDAAELWGLERSPEMLAAARARLDSRVHLVEGDMRDFSLPRRFALVLIPYRAFQHLLSARDQRKALRCIAQHLEPEGRLIVDLFDPRMELIAPHPADGHGEPLRFVLERPTAGGRVLVFKTRRIDAARQRLRENWIFEDVDANDRVRGRRVETLHLRYTFRWEMHHLLRRCGFRVCHLFGDFLKGPWRPGGEQIWVAERARMRGDGKEGAVHADRDMP